MLYRCLRIVVPDCVRPLMELLGCAAVSVLLTAVLLPSGKLHALQSPVSPLDSVLALPTASNLVGSQPGAPLASAWPMALGISAVVLGLILLVGGVGWLLRPKKSKR